MTITGAIVLFAVIWFMSLLVALPLGLRTHGDAGQNTQADPAFAPVNANVKRKMMWVTLVTFLLWAPLCLVIASGWISVSDLDFYNRFND
ncbi:DUF1467 family protein [Halovulum dunhuangense]|uniref:DUF1467 family protein n=1 Tax=Halovulum dunhuangense TaxID=1505036 RepID=A0A849L5G9_9RHOB|nr:DUF1467 family protein [Halovulum dunhuangense]NNU81606.1 DUF1467 family protein [Halovulum dunhuangense]